MNVKLHKFIEAALTNPLHPLFRFAGTAPALKQYAINVKVLETVSPEQWEKDYPQHVKQLEECLTLLEAEAKDPAPPDPDAAKVELERKLKEAEDALKAKDEEIKQLKAAATADGE